MKANRGCARKNCLLLAGLLVALISSALFAGGPLVVDYEGGYFTWNPAEPVTLTIDLGPLGNMDNSTAAGLVRSSAQKWTDLETSTIAFSDGGSLPVDVSVDNYLEFMGTEVHPENPVIFDNAGLIIEDIYGAEASSSVLGFAGVRQFDPVQRRFVSGWAVLNGKSAGSGGIFFVRTLVHELGHLLGLGHSQGLLENADNPFSRECDLFCGDQVPLMYPLLLLRGPSVPIRDDFSWVSTLYPEAGYGGETGKISGRVLRRSGGALYGANVVAVSAIEQADGTFKEGRKDIVSCVSDYLLDETGSFELPGLLPGKYFVFIEPIRSTFTGGSRVGPMGPGAGNYPRDYWNVSEASDDNPFLKDWIEVGAGEEVADIEIVANEQVNRLDQLKDDDEMLLEFPTGFSFPFFGKVYNDVFVNSDGNLTFGIGDGRVGMARTVDRFLSGPPRVAPLFSDLNPDGIGEVRAETGNGFVKIIWDGVPEFTDSGVAPLNYFSVTLYSTGNILFHYDQVKVTPDDNVLAVVGVAPGVSGTGSAADLSTAPSPLSYSTAGLYEEFLGSSFDLEGAEVLFEAASSRLLFPLLRGDSQQFTGIAVTNYGTTSASINSENRGTDGSLMAPPVFDEIPAGQQKARLGWEFLGLDPNSVRSGWVQMFSSHPQLASFFQIGDAVGKLDGSVAFTEQSQVLYFTRLYDGAGVYPALTGFQNAKTLLSIANPNEDAIVLTCRLFNAAGAPIGSAVERNLPPFGSLFERVSELFGVGVPLAEGFVEVQVEGPGAIGFELIELDNSLFGLNAAFSNSQKTLYSAQLGHGAEFFTSLKLVNPTDALVNIDVTAYLQEAEGVSSKFAKVTLGPKQSFQVKVQSLFGLLAPPGSLIVGSIVAESSGAGIVGDVVFGDPSAGVYAAAMPLQTRLFRKAIHSQISNGVHGGDPRLDSFTGLALFNPNQTDVSVTIKVYGWEGNLLGEVVETLGPRERVSKLLIEFLPDTLGVVGGSVRLEADKPVVAQQFFGNSGLFYLSAVPPTIIE